MGRKALITGGTSGIGRACAERLAADGLEVVTAALTREADVVLDVTDPARVAAVVAEVGPVDVLVNSAGVLGPGKPLAQISDAEWADTFAVNVTGTFHLCRAVTPGMVERGNGGAIVITGSTSTFRGVAYKTDMLNPGHMAYGAAKAGVLALMRNYAMALGKYGIRVNTIVPAGVNTPMIANEFFANDLAADAPPGWMANVMERGPVEPGDISDGVLFLLSDEAKYVTGTALPVDMGTLLI